MILGPVSLLDAVIFCVLLLPQLLWHVGLVRTLRVGFETLPFLLLQLPLDTFRHRLWLPSSSLPVFWRESSLFEYVVIRCVRYGFKNIPPDIGNVFLSKAVSLPFLRWRMLRHGLVRRPNYWHEFLLHEGDRATRGLWLRHDPHRSPDIVIFYLHGGGFSLGSSYFYLEFLLAWLHLLVDAGFENPAVFALDYTLVPDAVYPTQLSEVARGYGQALEVAGDASRVCLAGDSAGGALALSLLLQLGARLQKSSVETSAMPVLTAPRMAVLISPWVKLKSDAHYQSEVDYLDRQRLWQYAQAYAGEQMLHQQPASPGSCTDEKLWKAAAPQRGYVVVFGEQEVFAPDIEDFVDFQARNGVQVETSRFEGGIHAWPVVSMFLSDQADRRLQGLRYLVGQISRLARSDAQEVADAGVLRLDQVNRHTLAK
ncbi:hypothetical protein L249_8772 [Ophiocordyceps polyrhachis-furcata BCC 54312]|uniref:Alpha/beta hydrolase fold-3 domain-containing protein n=1 Tax=Ophiocordyceps polyrhachis-furcata BCC 54312 TaxID=1330021 RepID=A0A367L1U6_9HYPO|nr:hypothetical protein L249_8772 [Ophiocordyceps polyrhachis-furcata BCC 54312]